MLKFSSLLGGLILLAGLQQSQGQNLGNSPYSKLGIGEINEITNARNFGMGNIGVSTPNGYQVNVQNPAMLYYNSRVTFEIAAVGQFKKIANNNSSENVGSASFNYLALALPITKSWRTAIGLRPYSAVNYNTAVYGTVRNDPANTGIVTGTSGEGTISEAYFSNGIKLAKGLSVGATGSFLFGAINKDAYTYFVNSEGVATSEQTVVNNKTSVSDVTFKAGVAYRYALNKKLSANFGAIYGLGSDLNYSQTSIQGRRYPENPDLWLDSVRRDQGQLLRGELHLPAFWQAGVSLDNNNNWALAAEVSGRKWSAYKADFNSLDQKFADSFKMGIGGEYTPDPTSVESYRKRISYRAGFNYTQTPIEIGDTQLKDVALHLGMTLPIGTIPRPPEYNQSFINLGVAVGRNGTLDNNLLRETYVRFVVGISLNSSWFIRAKID